MRDELEQKVEIASKVLREAIEKNPNIAVACSFGKDSMVTVDLARKVKPDIPVFSIMTPYKPKDTFTYIQKMDKLLNLNVEVHYAGHTVPKELEFLGDRLKLYPEIASRAENYTIELNNHLNKILGEVINEVRLYEIQPSLCCNLYKTEVTRRAVKEYDAWICGLRKDESLSRAKYKYMENNGDGLIKINPIIDFSEKDVLDYLKDRGIPLHPWYTKEFTDGRRYRSLGCEPCTSPIYPEQKERDGRWKDSLKCGGECGIHTQQLKY